MFLNYFKFRDSDDIKLIFYICYYFIVFFNWMIFFFYHIILNIFTFFVYIFRLEDLNINDFIGEFYDCLKRMKTFNFFSGFDKKKIFFVLF